MLTIIKERDSGKTKQLLDAAKNLGAAVVTPDKRAFSVKAHSLGFDDIEILDFDDLNEDQFVLDQHIVIHQVEKLLEYLLDRFYGLHVDGFSATYMEQPIKKEEKGKSSSGTSKDHPNGAAAKSAAKPPQSNQQKKKRKNNNTNKTQQKQ